MAEGPSASGASPSRPRIPPTTTDERDERMTAVLAVAQTPTGAIGGNGANIFTTLIRHPGLVRRWLPFGGKLMTGDLPPAHRELMVLRTAWQCASEYEWGQHVLVAESVGLPGEMIERVKAGPDHPGWSVAEAALLRAVDELHDSSCISDDTWDALSAIYDHRQLIEIPFLVGHYHMVAFTLNSLGITRDAGVPGFDGRTQRLAGST